MHLHTVRPRDARFVVAAALAAALLGCGPGGNSKTPFPLSEGFQPLEPLVAEAQWPAATATDAHPEGLGPVVQVRDFRHYTSHARGYLHAPLARVYLALHDPRASLIHNQDGATRLAAPTDLGVEDFPISFLVHYKSSGSFAGISATITFDVTYRGGPLEGTDAAPVRVGVRYQKTDGTDYIDVMEGSLVATAVEGAPEVTAVEMVAWLTATTQDQSNCDGTLVDLFGDLQGVLAALP